MAVTPIRGRCRRCRTDFYLFELVNRRSGLCPRCGRALTPDWSEVLLDTTVRADAAQRAFVAALYRLSDLPGGMVLRPHSVLRNLFEEVGWERALAEDPELLADELDQLRRLFADWERLEPVAAAQDRASRSRRAWRWFSGRRPEICRGSSATVGGVRHTEGAGRREVTTTAP